MHTALLHRLTRTAGLVATIVFALMPHWTLGAPVTASQAEQVARNFWNAHRDKGVAMQTAHMQLLSERWDAFYIFESTVCDGFVIVSADDRVEPLLAYSFSNAVRRDSINPAMAMWLDSYQQQMDNCRAQQLTATAAVQQQWYDYTTGPKTIGPLTTVQPLTTTQWDQGSPYNRLCPSTSNEPYSQRAVTGCVATAMAQVMKYWNFPQHGTGSHTYTPEYFRGESLFGDQSADFESTYYDWEHMIDQYSSTASNTEINAVATLMYHCGVAVDMQYGTSGQGGSGAYTHNAPLLGVANTLNAMVQYFGYSSSATALMRKHYDNNTWRSILRNELAAGRPIIYSGGDSTGGHCFVCDGYANLGKFHFNWGWGGFGDGYFEITSLTPGSGGVGGGNYNYTEGQEILVNIVPHGDNDSLCVIRQFPYLQDFESAPTCWSATGSHYYSNWWAWDEHGTMGNMSAYVTASYDRQNDAHMLSPFIVDPGVYSLHWKARGLDGEETAQYTVELDGDILLADTIGNEQWLEREATFTVHSGDTVQLDFHYQSNGQASGVMIDSIVIDRIQTLGIDPVAQRSHTRIYPNPATDRVSIASDATVLSVELLDLSGRTLCRTTDSSINLSRQPAGLYLLRVTTTEATEYHRLGKISGQ